MTDSPEAEALNKARWNVENIRDAHPDGDFFDDVLKVSRALLAAVAERDVLRLDRWLEDDRTAELHEQIGMLKAERDELQAANARWVIKCQNQQAEIDRLREVLKDFAKQELSADMSVDDQLGGDFEGAYNHMVECARAALGDKE